MMPELDQIAAVARLFAGALIAFAAFSKLIAPARAIPEYPSFMNRPGVRRLIVPIELLIVGVITSSPGHIAGIAALTFFVGVTIFAIATRTDCDCFGRFSTYLNAINGIAVGIRGLGVGSGLAILLWSASPLSNQLAAATFLGPLAATCLLLTLGRRHGDTALKSSPTVYASHSRREVLAKLGAAGALALVGLRTGVAGAIVQPPTGERFHPDPTARTGNCIEICGAYCDEAWSKCVEAGYYSDHLRSQCDDKRGACYTHCNTFDPELVCAIIFRTL